MSDAKRHAGLAMTPAPKLKCTLTFLGIDKERFLWYKDVVTDAVNGIVLSPEFPAKPDALVMLSMALLVSRDGGQSWSDWKAGLAVEQGLASVAAPQGLDPEAPLLVGLVEGGVLRV